MTHHLRRGLIALLLFTIITTISFAQSDFWEPLPGLRGGDVGEIFRDSRGRIFACTFAGGIHYSDDSGSTWRRVQPENIYARRIIEDAKGDLLAASSRGVYRSTDGGGHWQQLGLSDKILYTITVDNAGNILVGGDAVYKSTDDGATWSELLESGTLCVNILALPSGRILACMFDALEEFGYINYSDNGGSSWQSMNIGHASYMALDASGRVHVAAAGQHLRSDDNGDSWDTVSTYPADVRHAESMFFTSTGDLLLIEYSKGMVYRSTNNGNSWRRFDQWVKYARGFHLISPGLVLAGTMEWGVVRSTDGGLTWKEANEGIETVRVKSLAAGPDGRLFVTSHYPFGPGSLRMMRRHGEQWTMRSELFNEWIRTAVTLPTGHILTTGQERIDRYDVTQERWIGPSFEERDAHIFVADVLPDGRVLCTDVSGRVFYSTDAGVTWRTIDAGTSSNTTAILLPDGTFLLGSPSGIRRSTDQGESWSGILLNIAVRGLVYDGKGKVFASVTPGSPASGGPKIGMYTSIDGGVTWTPAGMEDTLVNALIADRAGTVYAGVRNRVFRTNGGSTWEPLDSLEYGVTAFAIDSSGYLYVGTSGDGVFRTRNQIAPAAVRSEEFPVAERSRLAVDADGDAISIDLDMPAAGRARIDLYNLLGEKIALLLDDDLPAGRNAFVRESGMIRPGLYFCHLTVDGENVVRPLLIRR